jgi:cyanophycin synthetase
MYKTSILGLRSNQRFLVWELERRGIELSVINLEHELLQAKLNNHTELLLDIDSSLMPLSLSTLCNHKHFAKDVLMGAGLRVPLGFLCKAEDSPLGVTLAESLGYPLVVKPCQGSNGELVFVNIENAQELIEAMQEISTARGDIEIEIEEYFAGIDIKVFITSQGDFAALHREPAFIIGDGVLSIEELAQTESDRRKEVDISRLAPIKLDLIAKDFLAKKALSFQSIPLMNEKIVVRPNANIGSGGISEDCTDQIDNSLLTLAKRALAAFPKLPYAGIDFNVKSIQAVQSTDSYRLLEVNPLPSLGIHMMPAIGQSRNVAAMLVDLMFPESKK